MKPQASSPSPSGGKPAAVDLLSGRQRLILGCIAASIAAAWLQLLAWLLRWLWTGAVLRSLPLLLLSAAFSSSLLISCVGSLLWLALLFRAKKVNEALEPPRFRVAMIATKVPSEPLSMLQETLLACLNQTYPYPFDVWLADEDPDAATKAWCAENGVHISCRKGVASYHRPEWPRRTRCKEGNVAYFYDTVGYYSYDVVAQFDADHVPTPSYLSTALPAFLDDAVGYVACPSICGANEKDCGWVVRMRLFEECLQHGPQGASYSLGWLAPCIGSHYLVRTKHLKAVGGIGPELDEDMSTSIIMSAAGYKGAFSIATEANGDGPVSFEDSMHQDYQWARSGAILFLQYLRPCFWQGSLAVKLRMIHIVANWLVLSALSALFPALLLLAALNAGTSDGLGTLVPAFANPREPVLLYLVQLASGQLMLAAWISRNGWLRPVDTPVISWEAMLHSMCRVLFATKGIVHGLWSYYTQVPLNIRVTPKGPQGEKLMPTSAIWPFCVSAMLAAAAGLVQPGLALVAAPTALAHCIIPCLLVGLHYRDHHTLRSFPFHNAISLAVPIVTAASLVLTLLRHRGKWTARPRPPPSHAFTSTILRHFLSSLLSRNSLRVLVASHPGTTAYTLAMFVSAVLALCFSRSAFFTPLRTHRRSASSKT